MSKRKMPRQRPGLSESSVGTPPEFLIAAKRKLKIQTFCFDLAADANNAVCPTFYDESDNSLAEGVSWVFDGIDWLNPPFSRIGPWVAKAVIESANGARIAILIPASIGARWWINSVVGKCQIIPLDGRIVFVGQTDPYPKDCALLVYGPDVEIGYAPAWKWMDELTEEEREMAKKRIGKPKKEPKAKKAKAVKVRKAAKITDIKTRKRRGEKKADGYKGLPVGESARVTTFAPNAGTSQGIPALNEFNPGKIELPSPEDSVKLLLELATLNDQALKANSRYEELKGFTKDAKEKYDDLMKRVGERLRQGTHASDLPLFANVEKREQDQAAMEAAGTVSDPVAEVAEERANEAMGGEPEPEPEPVAGEPGEAEADELVAGEVPAPTPALDPIDQALSDEPQF